ncbi:MAG: septum formation initiator family protein [Coriobacteriia bacterium]|nr:septum formation initiator family protein [Coriobacteriia bacterium]
MSDQPSWLREDRAADPMARRDRQAAAPAPRRSRFQDDLDAPAGPRAAVTTFEDEEEEEPVEPGLRGKLAKMRHERKKAQAERKFNQQFEGDTPSADEAGPRAALYRGEMGSNQRRAARMQDQGEGRSRAAVTTTKSKSLLARVVTSAPVKALGATVACLLLAVVFLYPTAQQFYVSVREHDRVEAELKAVEARNQELQSEVASLGTAEGIAARAHQEYGWVMKGENSVYVQGVKDGSATGSSVSANVVPGSIKAPETWYSPVLDAFFHVDQ